MRSRPTLPALVLSVCALVLAVSAAGVLAVDPAVPSAVPSAEPQGDTAEPVDELAVRRSLARELLRERIAAWREEQSRQLAELDQRFRAAVDEAEALAIQADITRSKAAEERILVELQIEVATVVGLDADAALLRQRLRELDEARGEERQP